MLLYIYLFNIIWRNYQNAIEQSQTDPISMGLSILKMATLFRTYFVELINPNSTKNMIKQIKTHCIYEKRKGRDNARESFFELAA